MWGVSIPDAVSCPMIIFAALDFLEETGPVASASVSTNPQSTLSLPEVGILARAGLAVSFSEA